MCVQGPTTQYDSFDLTKREKVILSRMADLPRICWKAIATAFAVSVAELPALMQEGYKTECRASARATGEPLSEYPDAETDPRFAPWDFEAIPGLLDMGETEQILQKHGCARIETFAIDDDDTGTSYAHYRVGDDVVSLAYAGYVRINGKRKQYDHARVLKMILAAEKRRKSTSAKKAVKKPVKAAVKKPVKAAAKKPVKAKGVDPDRAARLTAAAKKAWATRRAKAA